MRGLEGGRQSLEVADPLADDVADLLLSAEKLGRSARGTNEGDVSAVSSALDEDGLDGGVGDGLVDGECVPRVNVAIHEDNVVGGSGRQITSTIVLVGLLDLELRFEVNSVHVRAEINPVLHGHQISEGLS